MGRVTGTPSFPVATENDSRHCLMPLKRQNHGTLRSTKLPFSSESPETCVVILKRAAHGKKVDMPCFIMIGLKKYE